MDEFTIEILADGTIKSSTGVVGPQNHQNAEGFFGFLSRLTGGKATRSRRGDHAHVHQHEHGEAHEHN